MKNEREMMAATENILDEMFFGERPVFKALMDNGIKPHFIDREDQIRVLLGMFAMKEYTRIVQEMNKRDDYMEALLTPQAGEIAH